MSIEEILDQFVISPKGFPYDALAAVEKQPAEFMPHLLRLLESVVTDPDLLEAGDLRYLFAIFLLAKFREPEAYSRIVDIAILPYEQVDWILGDSITEDLHRWLASVANGDLTQIDRLVRDNTAFDFCRGAGVRAVSLMVFNGLLDRDAAIDYLRTLFHDFERDQKYMVVWTALVMEAAELAAVELANEVDQVFEDGLFDLSMTGREDIDADLRRNSEKHLAKFTTDRDIQLIDDVAEEMDWWHVWRPSPEQEPKVVPKPSLEPSSQQPRSIAAPKLSIEPGPKQPGRNDPCPCGSGKKYKKCHGKKN